jgi:hypothetical protein
MNQGRHSIPRSVDSAEIGDAPEPSFERKYPLLSDVLKEKGLLPKGMYTYRDFKEIFGCSKRAVQDYARDGKLTMRDLPGRAHWLSCDLENFLQNSIRTPKSGSEKK